MKKLFLIVLLMSIAASGLSQKTVHSLPADSNTIFGKNHFLYTLPQTAFQLDVVVNRHREIKGVYAEYADKLLGLCNIIKQNQTSYSLKSVAISPITLPDEEQVFAVELSKQQIKDSFFIKLFNNQHIVQTPIAPTYTIHEKKIPDFFQYYSNLSYTEQENSYVETQIVDGVVRQVPASHIQKITKTNEQQAQEAADKVEKIRKDRYALLAGEQEIAYEVASLNQMVTELNTLEKNYLSLFAGFVVEDEIHYNFIVTPRTADTPCVAFSISPTTGFSVQESTPANTYYLHFTPALTYETWDAFATTRAKSKKYKPANGYRIRRSVPTHITLVHAQNEIYSFGSYPIFQFGRLETLPTGLDTFDITKFIVIY